MASRPGRELAAVLAITVAVVAAGLLAVGPADPAGAAGRLKLARVGGFDAPVYVEDAPGASKLLFVVEQPGSIRVLRSGRELKRDFLDIRSRVTYSGEQGLLSVAFDPGYARNRRFYVYYVNRAGNLEVDGFRRQRRNPTRAAARSRRKVIVIPHPGFENHNGGQLQFGPDKLLYMATGDGGGAGDSDGNAQNPDVLLGKLLRIEPRKRGGYRTPGSNPFAGRGGRDEVYALGLRNPYRFSFAGRSGAIFIGDVGQGDWEEIDRVGRRTLAGSNFGWNIFEGTHDFLGGPAPANYRPPAFEYSSNGGNCAVIGGYVVRRSLPSLRGRYLYADHCGGAVRSFDPSNPGASDSATGLELSQPSSFGEGAHGRIYVASLGGAVYRIKQK